MTHLGRHSDCSRLGNFRNRVHGSWQSFETDQKGGRGKNPKNQDESDAGQEAQVNRDKGFKSRSEDEDAEGKGS
jgi:hypothetical protein